MGEKAGSLRAFRSFPRPCLLAEIGSVAGEHTRTIQIATPTIGGLMKFAVKTVTCLGCRTPLKSNKGVLVVSGCLSPLTISRGRRL